VSECDHESSTMRWSWPTGRCCAMVKKNPESRVNREETTVTQFGQKKSTSFKEPKFHYHSYNSPLYTRLSWAI